MKLEIKDASFGYRKDKLIFENINLSVTDGDVLAILGPNGAGKTTLLKCLMGLLTWRQGASFLNGVNIRTISAKNLWQQIAYVPQAKGVSSAFTVEEMVLLGRGSHLNFFSKPQAKDFELVDELLERLHITKLKGKHCNQLSGGELQMVLIARALASNAQILILDEPESNLDFKNQLIVLDTISSLAAQGMICLFNTHYPAHALQRSNKAFILSKGGEYKFGSTRSLITEENIAKAFGVKAVIGQVETPGQMFTDVIPLSVLTDPLNYTDTPDKEALAVISIINGDFAQAENINNLLHCYSQYLIGRMGMPYKEDNVYIINITLKAPKERIEELVHALSLLPKVNVKATYATLT